MSEQTTPVPTPTKESKPRDPIYITIILLLLIGGGFLYWKMDQAYTELEKCNQNVTDVESQRDNAFMELNAKDAESFKDSLNVMLNKFDNLIEANQQLKDENIANQDSLLAQRDRIEGLLDQVNRHRYDRAKLLKEMDVLRGVMQGYARRIDSLTTENHHLRDIITVKDTELEEAGNTISQYETKTTELQETVKAGQKLTTAGMTAGGIRLKSDGSQRDTERAKRTNRVKSCFTVMTNPIAKPGEKTLYLRVIAPDGKVLGPAGQTMKMGDSEGAYSVSRTIDYNNQDVDACIYYIFGDVAATKGTYVVELWCEGHRIGKTSMDLR